MRQPLEPNAVSVLALRAVGQVCVPRFGDRGRAVAEVFADRRDQSFRRQRTLDEVDPVGADLSFEFAERGGIGGEDASAVLQAETVVGKYYCSYGINPAFQESLNKLPLIFTAFSPTGEVRAFELTGHRFFKGTLFQPSLDSSAENPNPLIKSFFEACR